MDYSLQRRLLWFFFIFSLLKTKVIRVALLVTHKRITAKTSVGRSIDADIKPARFIGVGYLRHTMQNISFFSSSNLTRKILFSMLVGIFEFDFLHIFSLSQSLLGCSSLLESGFLLLPIQISRHLVHQQWKCSMWSD